MMSSKDKSIQSTLKYRWLMWGVMVLSYALVYFHSYSMGVVKNSLISEFSLTEQTFVSIGNVYFYLYLLMQVPTGILVDTLGARLTASLGTLTAAIGIVIFSFGQSLMYLYLGRSLVGLGTAVIFVSIIKVQSNWFKDSEFGTITGLTCFIGVMGGAVAQTPLALMVEALGWRTSLQIIGFLSLVITAMIYLIVRDTPKELGMPALSVEQASAQSQSAQDILKGLVKVFVNPRTWPVFLMYAAFYGSYVIITGYYGTAFIMDVYGKTMVEASAYLIPAIVGAAVGSVFVGAWSDRMRSRKIPLLVVGGVYVATWLVLVFVGSGAPAVGLLTPIMFMIGFASCAYVVSWPAVKEVNDPNYVGVSVAVANIGGFVGPIVLPPIAALSLSKSLGILEPAKAYQGAFMWILGAVTLGFVLSFFVKETNCINIYEPQGGSHLDQKSVTGHKEVTSGEG